MQYQPTDPAEADVRFQGYRLEIISQWPPSRRKVALAEAISQRLTNIGRGALVRPDVADLLHLSCQLLDDFFAESASDAAATARAKDAADRLSTLSPTRSSPEHF